MTIYIHVPKKKKTKKGNFERYIVSHMEIDCKEHKAPNMTEKEANQKDNDIYLFLDSKTRREVSGDFQVDLQDQACCR
jgi:hypothetical protein